MCVHSTTCMACLAATSLLISRIMRHVCSRCQLESLNNAAKNVFSDMSLVSKKYQKNNNIMGAIINYVFQGVNTTKNMDVETIGNAILKKVGRYDSETKKLSRMYQNNKLIIDSTIMKRLSFFRVCHLNCVKAVIPFNFN